MSSQREILGTDAVISTPCAPNLISFRKVRNKPACALNAAVLTGGPNADTA